MNSSLVFNNARLLDTFHKLLKLHVFCRQLESLYGAFLVPVSTARTFPLLVPFDPTDKPFEFGLSIRLSGDFNIMAEAFVYLFNCQ